MEAGNALFDKDAIIWVTRDTKTGEILWLELGKNDYTDRDKGAGLEHIFIDHTIKEFGSDEWGRLTTPKQQAQLLLDVISSDPNYKMSGNLRVYEVNINGKTKYLAVLQSHFNGFIVTARPFPTKEGIKLFSQNP